MLQIPTHPEQTIKRRPLKLDSKILEEDLYFTKEQVLKFAHFLVHWLRHSLPFKTRGNSILGSVLDVYSVSELTFSYVSACVVAFEQKITITSLNLPINQRNVFKICLIIFYSFFS